MTSRKYDYSYELTQNAPQDEDEERKREIRIQSFHLP